MSDSREMAISCHRGMHSPCAIASRWANKSSVAFVTLTMQSRLFHVQLLPAQTVGAAAPADEPGRQLAEREHLWLCDVMEGGR